jgi:autotransporter-associated beta strand protein
MNGASLTVLATSSFTDSAVNGGAGGTVQTAGLGTFSAVSGSAYGKDIFVGGNVVLNAAPGQSLTVTDLGGAGNLSDPSVSSNASDPNANGSLTVIGGGSVTLAGTSYHSGNTTIHSGTLTLAPYATEQGTTFVTVGQNSGDNATLVLSANSNFTLGGWNAATPTSSTDHPVMIAQATDSEGRIVIGNGAGSSGASIAAREFTGGSGSATVEFTQQFAAGSETNSVYTSNTTLTGNLSIVQSGIGTTLLSPAFGANTFSGNVAVNSGTLATAGTNAALAGTTLIIVNSNAVFAPGQSNGINDTAVLELAGGVLAASSQTSLSDSIGVLNVTANSRIDLGGADTSLTFNFLVLDAPLAIWNYSAVSDFIRIASGESVGNLSQISFFADSGQTFLGTGIFNGTLIVPVPEPAAFFLGAVALVLFAILRRRTGRTS